jgi:hypothetical protein
MSNMRCAFLLVLAFTRRTHGQIIPDCSGEEWAANCDNPSFREFCDSDASILAEEFARSICAPVATLAFLIGEGDYCGRCKRPQDLVFEMFYPSNAPSSTPLSAKPSVKSFMTSISSLPSAIPSGIPSNTPSGKSSGSSMEDSGEQGGAPSSIPSGKPSGSSMPSRSPSDAPSSVPSGMPSGSSLPSGEPSYVPSAVPSGKPSGSSLPSGVPSYLPSTIPSGKPSSSSFPSGVPSRAPSTFPTGKPSGSSLPSGVPSNVPSSIPSGEPSSLPSSAPSGKPSGSSLPSSIPSGIPSVLPSELPAVATVPPTQNVVSSGRGDIDVTDCAAEKWRVNCANPSHREFCDFDATIVKNDFPRSVCAPLSNLQFLMSAGDYCGRCKSSQELIVDKVPSAAPINSSAMPTPSGSSFPSTEPSSFPSGLPSGAPSGSALPSLEPSSYPSIFPSDIPSGVPSFNPSDLVLSSSSEFEVVATTYAISFSSDDGLLKDDQIAVVEEAIRDFLNVEWPFDDTRGTVITEVSIVAQTSVPHSSRSVRRRLDPVKDDEGNIELKLEIHGVVSPDARKPYDFLRTIVRVFDESKLVLRNSLEDLGIVIAFS